MDTSICRHPRVSALWFQIAAELAVVAAKEVAEAEEAKRIADEAEAAMAKEIAEAEEAKKAADKAQAAFEKEQAEAEVIGRLFVMRPLALFI